MRENHRAGPGPSRPLALMLAAAVAVGCASGGGTTTTSSAGEVDQSGNRVADTSGRVPPATGGISPTANPPALGPGVTGAPQPGTPAVASRDSSPGPAGVTSSAGMNTTAGGAAGAGGAMGNMGATSEANVVALLHESNLGEIRAGTLAQQRASSQAVRGFASQMVTDHTALDQRGNSIAQSAGITPSLPNNTLPEQNTTDVSALQGQSGAAFDRAYIAQQVVAHQRTLALVDASLPLVQTAALRTALQNEVRPRVAEHLRMAQQLQTQVGTSP